MIASIVIVAAIFGYAAWSLYRFVQKSKQGKCAACSVNKSCTSSSCSIPADLHSSS